jgi:hypothetical protein
MKNILLLIIIISTGFISCAKDKAADEIIPINNICDSINPASFMNDIEPLLNNNGCYGCHAAQSPIFIDYASVFLERDRILATIQHDPSFSAMPQNGQKLADSLINKMQCWIESGAPNN